MGSVTARTYSWKTIGGAGVGQTTSASHLRGAGRQWAWPVANVLSQAKGGEAILRGFAVTETLVTGATQLSHGFVIDLGDVDGGEVARTHQPGQLAGIAAVGCDAVPSFFRNS